MSKKYKKAEYLQKLLPCPKCGSDECREDGNESESAVSCLDCGFEVVTNNVAKSKTKWNKLDRGEHV
ncbi:hypothetical protein RMB13_07155 [Acinetobacter sp. V102_4]|uniref:Lar family restriction alleviation protein n=1 Tax=Acinetobacter sp. V102_4 TaxID=3072984 RepID=UPI00287CEEBF|nr:Lar family restriction alleviation protein [Acinetobacter sp. V102_4]MDS7929255.1 hypothetical protein [Acinetobacter sp. V102_4]